MRLYTLVRRKESDLVAVPVTWRHWGPTRNEAAASIPKENVRITTCDLRDTDHIAMDRLGMYEYRTRDLCGIALVAPADDPPSTLLPQGFESAGSHRSEPSQGGTSVTA